MRRGTMLVLGLLMASVAIPQQADARPRGAAGLFGFITSPIRTLLHAGQGGRRSHQRRAKASRARPAETAQSKPDNSRGAVPVVAGAAAGAAAASAVRADTPQNAAATAATPGTSPAAVPASVATESIPLPAPAPSPLLRNAALVPPSGQSPTSGDEASRPPASRQSVRPAAESKLGLVGPLVWPSAYEDVIGFTLWPQEYGGKLRGHGIGDVLTTIFTPSATLAARTLPNATQAKADRSDVPATPAASLCGEIGPTSDWPSADLARAMQLSAAQRMALDKFTIAQSDAVAAIRSTCNRHATLSPGERLRAMQNTLWAVHDATTALRGPLAAFYDTLNEGQKRQLTAPTAAASDPRAASRDSLARMCGVPASNDLQMRQIEQTLHPTKAQRTSLDALQKKSFEMGQFLMASCLKPVAATPTERLDAAADRLTAVIFAASTVGLALNDFYNQLSSEQKSKLSTPGS